MATSTWRISAHTMEDLVGDWDRPHSREQACFSPDAFRVDKYWSAVESYVKAAE